MGNRASGAFSMNNRIDTPMDPFRAFMDAGAGEPLRKSMMSQMERFWEGQRKMLEEYETFSRAMLERRRTAADATLDTLRKMGTSSDSAEWTKCASDWFTGSVTRIAEDGRDMMTEGFKMWSEVSQAMTAGMAETAQATAETQQRTAEASQAAARNVAAAQTAAAEQAASSTQEAARLAAARAAQRAPKRPEEGARA
jgi:hypothetical protein